MAEVLPPSSKNERDKGGEEWRHEKKKNESEKLRKIGGRVTARKKVLPTQRDRHTLKRTLERF